MFIVKDKNGKEWGEYPSFQEAWETVCNYAEDKLREEGIDINKTYMLQQEHPELEHLIDKLIAEYILEYEVTAKRSAHHE